MIKKYQIVNKEKQDYYVKIKDAILFDKRLNGNDFKLLVFYQKVSFDKNYSYYSIKTISEILNLSNKTIINTNKKLEYLKYITIKRYEKNKPNRIFLNKIKNINGFDFIKNIIEKIDESVVKKLHYGQCKNYTTGSVKITHKEKESTTRNKKIFEVEKKNNKIDFETQEIINDIAAKLKAL